MSRIFFVFCVFACLNSTIAQTAVNREMNVTKQLALEAISRDFGVNFQWYMYAQPNSDEEAKQMLIGLKRYDDAIISKIVEKRDLSTQESEDLLRIQIAQQKLVRKRIPQVKDYFEIKQKERNRQLIEELKTQRNNAPWWDRKTRKFYSRQIKALESDKRN